MTQHDDMVSVARARDFGRRALRMVTAGSFDEFVRTDLNYVPVVHLIGRMADMVAAVSNGFRDAHPSVPWDAISGLANRVQPDLFKPDVRAAWDIAAGPLPGYVDALDAVVPEGFGDAVTVVEDSGRPDPRTAERLLQTRLNVPADELAALCRRYRIKRLRVFGSVLRDDFGPRSDVDVLVDFEPGVRVGRELLDLQEEISDLVGGRDVDVMRPDSLDRYVRSRVLSTAREIYAA